ncbi:MAG TPA: hypothetical protein VHE12_11085 [bacterium]|nr:hypothetical protein [bacterium]
MPEGDLSTESTEAAPRPVAKVPTLLSRLFQKDSRTYSVLKFVAQTVFIGLFSSVLIPTIMSSYKSRELHSEFYYKQRAVGAEAILGKYVELFDYYYKLCHEKRNDSGILMMKKAHEFRSVCNRYLMYFPSGFEEITADVYYFYMGLSYRSDFARIDRDRDAAIGYVDECWSSHFRELFEIPDVTAFILHPFDGMMNFFESGSGLPKISLVSKEPNNPYSNYYELVSKRMRESGK